MLNLSQSKKMKKALTITIIILLFASLLAADEVNQPAEKAQSVETKSLSADSIITAFTFLLAALTIMATLFGIFIGYMGYKSSKEYEKEATRAEEAAKRAEAAALGAEGVIKEIRQKGDKTITGMELQYQQMIQSITNQAKLSERESLEPKEGISEVFNKIGRKFVENDFKGAADIIEGAILFAQENAYLWHVWSLVLYLQNNFEDALNKIDIGIGKNPSSGAAYHMRASIKLDWWSNFGGPKPSKSEVINDIKNAVEYGAEFTRIDKKLLAKFLDNSEYKELFGKTKEEDGFTKE